LGRRRGRRKGKKGWGERAREGRRIKKGREKELWGKERGQIDKECNEKKKIIIRERERGKEKEKKGKGKRKVFFVFLFFLLFFPFFLSFVSLL